MGGDGNGGRRNRAADCRGRERGGTEGSRRRGNPEALEGAEERRGSVMLHCVERFRGGPDRGAELVDGGRREVGRVQLNAGRRRRLIRIPRSSAHTETGDRAERPTSCKGAAGVDGARTVQLQKLRPTKSVGAGREFAGHKGKELGTGIN